MKPEQQRIAIAEACGWRPHADGRGYYRGKHPLIMGGLPLPDYLNDLNAMHEAEELLTNEQADEYELALEQANDGYSFCATASQRAEAFLRTLNRWTE